MKLVRLTQNPPVSKTNDFCIFNSNFQVNLDLKPNSQVALQSLSFQLFDEGLVINPDDTPIVVSITNDGVDLSYIMYLPSRSYSETEYQQFFNDFMFALNKGLTFISNYLGTEWRVGLDETNKFLVIEFGRGLIGIEDIQLENVDQTGTIFEPSKAPAQNDVFLYFRKRLCRGVGYLRFRNSAADASDELFAGFTINPLNDSSATIDRSLVKFGIGISKVPHVYYYIVDGVKTNAVDVPAVNDILEIRINFGDLQIGYYRFNTGVFNVIHQVDDVFESGSNKILYPVIALQREDCQITDVSFTETPYEDGQYAKTSELLQVGGVGVNPPDPNLDNEYTFDLTFFNLEFANRLGFKTQQTPPVTVEEVTQNDLRGSSKFNTAGINDHFVVEMENINLDTYDNTRKGKFNILAVTSVADEEKIFRYVPPYPIFLDINNNQTLSMRNIKLKVLDENLDLIKTVGTSVATLLFKEKGE